MNFSLPTKFKYCYIDVMTELKRPAKSLTLEAAAFWAIR